MLAECQSACVFRSQKMHNLKKIDMAYAYYLPWILQLLNLSRKHFHLPMKLLHKKSFCWCFMQTLGKENWKDMKLPHSISTLKAYMKLFNIVKALAKGILCEHFIPQMYTLPKCQSSIFRIQTDDPTPLI